MTNFDNVKNILVDFYNNASFNKMDAIPYTPGYSEKKKLFEAEFLKLGEDLGKATKSFSLYEQHRVWQFVYDMVAVKKDVRIMIDLGTTDTIKQHDVNTERLLPILRGAASYTTDAKQEKVLVESLSGKDLFEFKVDTQTKFHINNQFRDIHEKLGKTTPEEKEATELIDTFRKNSDIDNQQDIKEFTKNICIVLEKSPVYAQQEIWSMVGEFFHDDNVEKRKNRMIPVVETAEDMPGMPARSVIISMLLGDRLSSDFEPLSFSRSSNIQSKKILSENLEKELKVIQDSRNDIEQPIKDMIANFNVNNDFSKEYLHSVGNKIGLLIDQYKLSDNAQTVFWKRVSNMVDEYKTTHQNIHLDIGKGALPHLTAWQRENMIKAFTEWPLAKTVAERAASIKEKYYKPVQTETLVVEMLYKFQESGYINPTAFKELGSNLAKTIEQVDAKQQEELWTRVHQSIIGYKKTVPNVFDSVIEGAKPYIINGTLDKDAMVYGISGIMSLLENKNTLKMR